MAIIDWKTSSQKECRRVVPYIPYLSNKFLFTMSIIDIMKGEHMGNEQTHTAEENVSNEETQQQVTQNGNAEQTTSEEGRSASGQAKPEQVDFEQMYNMLKERDTTIEAQKKEIADLKKTNTNLLLKVNASASSGAELKTPYEKFIDSMVER